MPRLNKNILFGASILLNIALVLALLLWIFTPIFTVNILSIELPRFCEIIKNNETVEYQELFDRYCNYDPVVNSPSKTDS